ncbi:MAG: phage terminase large subunit [Bacteroidetes bacterium]|nr:phage terminase large subunit [Bacteroidota bacterium]
MVTAPPQHGKSEGSSRKLPTFMHGLNPDLRIGIGSYASGTAKDFSRDCQRIIESSEYIELFPKTRLNSKYLNAEKSGYKRTGEVFEIVGYKGSLRAFGRGSGITSKTIDVMILDDVYKDYAEGNSPVIREQAWKWYVDAIDTRLHNDSQILIVFTRWNEDDLIGRIDKKETIIEVNKFSDLENIPEGAWVKVNFEAIKTSESTEIDPREKETALWSAKHSIKRLRAKRNLDKHEFDCLYQGSPGSKAGALYSEFKTYQSISDYGVLVGKGNYTDIADKGTDKLCSISYDLVRSLTEKDEKNKPVLYALVKDLVYTDEPVEQTLVSVPMMFKREGTRYANIESNAGGRTFAVTITPKVRATSINAFHQGDNKESRINTNASLVNNHIIMPIDWENRWKEFYEDVTRYKRLFTANLNDDAPDVMTGIVETEILGKHKAKGIKRRN